MDYVYSPANDANTNKEPEISLPPRREVSGYVKASSTLTELEEFEEDEDDIVEEKVIEEKVYSIEVDESIANRFPRETNERLQGLSLKANSEKPNASTKKPGFLVVLATTYMEILDELLFVNNFEDFKNIFKKENRMIAIGIFLVILAVILMFV